MKISARNRFKGKVTAVQKGAVMATVKVRVKAPITISATITKEAVEDLNLKKADTVEVVVKSTDVMILKET